VEWLRRSISGDREPFVALIAATTTGVASRRASCGGNACAPDRADFGRRRVSGVALEVAGLPLPAARGMVA